MNKPFNTQIATRLAATFFIIFLLGFTFFGATFFLQIFLVQKKSLELESSTVIQWFDKKMETFVFDIVSNINFENFNAEINHVTQALYGEIKKDDTYAIAIPSENFKIDIIKTGDFIFLYKYPLEGNEYIQIKFKRNLFWKKYLQSIHSSKGYIFKSDAFIDMSGVPYFENTLSVYPHDDTNHSLIEDASFNIGKNMSCKWIHSNHRNSLNASLYQIGRLESSIPSLTLGFLFESHLYLGILGILFIIILLYRYLWKFITLPIEQLKSAVFKATQGDLTAKTHLLPEGEIGELGYQFDQMIDKVKESKEKLENLNARLKTASKEKDTAQNELIQLNKNLESLIAHRTEEILNLKNFYQKILDDLTTGIVVIDPDGKLAFCNPFAKKFWHLPDLGQDIFFKQLNIPEVLKDLIVECLKHKSSTDNFEINQTGSVSKQNKILGAKITTIFNKDQLDSLIIMFQDITERKNFEKELLQTERVAKVALFASGMAHDTNNILNRIKIGINIITKKITHTAPDFKDILDEINLAITEGQNYTRSLVNIAQTESPVFEKVDINATLSHFCIKHSLYFPKIKIEFTPLAETTFIESNQQYLAQIFNNLIMNAFNALGEKDGRIAISLKKQATSVKVSFSDNGPGIHQDIIPYLFIPFHNLKFTKKNKGFGMGLSFVKFLAESIHGHIQLNYTSPEGTDFILEFPLWHKN